MAARLGLSTTTQSMKTTSGSVTPGTIISWGGANIPEGWLLLDGSSLSRTTYSSLFAILGTIYGFADSSHFNLPNLIGRVPIGAGTYTDPVSGSIYRAPGSYGGAEKHKVLNIESGSVAHDHAKGTLVSNTNNSHTHYVMSKYFATGIIELHNNLNNTAYSMMGGMVFGGAASRVSFSAVLGILTGVEPSRLQTSVPVGSGYNASGQHSHIGPVSTISFSAASENATPHNNMQPYIVQKWIIKV
jgi:microcystin-dependent protein